MSLSFKDRVTIITSGLVVQKWLIRFFITAWESYSNISFSSSSVFFFFFFFLLLLEVRQFEAERLTWLNFSLIEVRRESSSFCHLTHRNTKMFAPSPSCYAYSMVLLVQVISFEYRCGRQDHGRIQRLWTCKNNTPPNGCIFLHYHFDCEGWESCDMKGHFAAFKVFGFFLL